MVVPIPQRFSGLNGALPTVYDPDWQRYTDLSPGQITAFQSFPQDLTNYASFKRWIWEISGQSVNGPTASYITLPATNPNLAGLKVYTNDISHRKVAGLVQAISDGIITGPHAFKGVDGYRMLSSSDIRQVRTYMIKWEQATHVTEASLLSGINAVPPTITTRAQIDSAYQTALAAAISS